MPDGFVRWPQWLRARRMRLVSAAGRLAFCCVCASIAACIPDTTRNAASATPAGYQNTVLPLERGWQYAWEPTDSAGPQWSELSGARRYFPIDSAQRLRMRITLPAIDCRDPIVYFGLVNQSFVAHLNGTPVYRFGRPEAGPAGFAGWPFHMIPVRATDDRDDVLELHIFSDFSNIGVGGGVPELACRDAKTLDLLREDLPQAAIAALAILAGCFVVGLYRSSGRDHLFLSFALFSITAGVYLISSRTLRLQNLVVYAPMAWMYLSYVTLYTIPVAAGYFFRQVFEFSRPLLWAFRIWTLAIAALLAANIAGWLPWYRSHDPFLISIGAILLLTDVWMLRALFARDPERRVLGGVVIAFSACAGFDIFGALGLVPWPVQAMTIGFAIVLLGMAFVVLHRYSKTHRALQNYASDLEQEVAARTESLAQSLAEVHRLKEQQDGDYFLVSRLVEPMGGADLVSGQIMLSSFVEQRKKIRFRGWTAEVGGDLCLADRIVLNGREFVFFMNADAMGKSMQGAGGAIVIAVVYRALVARGDAQTTAEEWLLAALNELNFALSPFDGRMLVSLAIGLVDENGEVLFLSADHPRPVLYRAGRADFLTVQRPGTKLGHGDRAQFLAGRPERLDLQPGDRLIFGSDGRDDLAIPGEAADRLVDSDEQRFLQIVEICAGDLGAIVDRLRTRGEIIDDLSLLSIRYDESEIAR